jgi:hypothetical protein
MTQTQTRVAARTLAVLALLLLASLVYAQQTSRSAPVPNACGRYQLSAGPVEEVFDTQTGRIYTWMPRDEKADTGPYLMVRDPVNGSSTRVKIKWINWNVTPN